MQISTNYLFDRATSQMSTLQSDLAKTQNQIATQKQVLNPSDAPDQAAAIARLKSVIGRQNSYGSTLDVVQNRLNAEDSTLSSVGNLLIRIKEITLQAANDTVNSENRNALATELQGLRDQLLSLSNTRDVNGNYIFAGSRVQNRPFATDANGRVSYQGDQTRMQVEVGEQRNVPINRPGTAAFVRVVRDGEGVGFFQSLDDLTAAVKNSDQAGMQLGMGEADSLLQGALLAHAEVGSDMRVVEEQSTILQDIKLTLQTALSRIEDLDMVTAITQMNMLMLSLQAAQATFAKISQNSLFNYLR